MKKQRTSIGDISRTGYELSDTQLQRVTGGAVPTCTNGKCWVASSSVTDPCTPDTQVDCKAD